MKTVKVDAISVFSGKNDVRKMINLDMSDEDKEYFEEEYELDERQIIDILFRVTMYVDMAKAMNTKLELNIVEEAE